MTPEEIREYNKIVIEVSEQMVRPWKCATIILALLLIGMLCLYFFNPINIDVDQTANDSINTYSIVR